MKLSKATKEDKLYVTAVYKHITQSINHVSIHEYSRTLIKLVLAKVP